LFDGELRQQLALDLCEKCKFNPLSTKFISLLAKKNRTTELGNILEIFHKYLDEEAGVVRGQLLAAVEMPAGELNEIAASIGKRIGRKVELTEALDETLLGGFIARVGGKTFDSSLKTQLRSLKEACTAEF
jgi:F-type H+-transporting ATPase subunit delta